MYINITVPWKNIVKSLTTEDFLKMDYMPVYFNHKNLLKKRNCEKFDNSLYKGLSKNGLKNWFSLM